MNISSFARPRLRLVTLGACSWIGAMFAAAAPLKVGLIGLDTSHTVSFAKVLNDPKNPQHVDGAIIVAGFKGGSPDVENSASRIEGFTSQMVKTYGVKIYDSIEELARNVDAIMILSVDGRVHLEQARRVFPFHKPVFIDKPMAGTLRDALAIFRLAAETKTPCFSSSSRRFGPGIEAVKAADVDEKKEEPGYAPLLAQVVKFFETGISPVPPAETIELLTFLEAADESKRRGGAPVRLVDVLRASGG